MGQELEVPKTFEQKMTERIREQIGDLMDQEMLQKLVGRGIETAFFTEREEKDRYGNVIGRKPPLITEVVASLQKKQVEEQVGIYFSANADKIAEMVDQMLKNGIAGCVLNALNSRFQMEMISLGQALQENIKRDIAR